MSGSVSCRWVPANCSSPCFCPPRCCCCWWWGGGGALPCGCKPLIRSIRRHRVATTYLPYTSSPWPGEIPTSCYLWQEHWLAGAKVGWEQPGRWLVVGQLLLLLLSAPTVPLLLATGSITLWCIMHGVGCLGGVLQVYYYGRRSGRYLYCLCADHWLNRITNSGKHCRQTPLCFPSRRSRWASIQARKQNFRDDWKFWGWVIDVQVQGRSWLTLSSSTLIARQLISSPNIYQRQTLPKCGTSRKQVIKWQ